MAGMLEGDVPIRTRSRPARGLPRRRTSRCAGAYGVERRCRGLRRQYCRAGAPDRRATVRAGPLARCRSRCDGCAEASAPSFRRTAGRPANGPTDLPAGRPAGSSHHAGAIPTDSGSCGRSRRCAHRGRRGTLTPVWLCCQADPDPNRDCPELSAGWLCREGHGRDHGLRRPRARAGEGLVRGTALCEGNEIARHRSGQWSPGALCRLTDTDGIPGGSRNGQAGSGRQRNRQSQRPATRAQDLPGCT